MNDRRLIMKSTLFNKILLTFFSVAFMLITYCYFSFCIDNAQVTSTIFISIGFLIVLEFMFLYLIIGTWTKKQISFSIYENLLLVSISIFVLSFPIAYLFLELGRNLSFYVGAKIGTSDAWLGFIGSLFGGIITAVSLAFTFRMEDKKNEQPSLTQQLEYLDILLKRKAITKNEYILKKENIFEQMKNKIV